MKQMKIKIKDHEEIYTVKKYYDERSGSLESDELNDLEEKLIKHKKLICYQNEWMGRSCYKYLSSGKYINIKGCGPGPGSEHMRKYLDKVWKKKFDGGCFRLRTDTQYPMLVQFKKKRSGWEVFDPRPEGASIFGAILREAEASDICSKLGLAVIEPKLVLRNHIMSPWEKEGINVEEYLLKKAPKALSAYLGISEPKQEEIQLNKIYYTDMDSGILLRVGKSPYRLSNLHEASTSENYQNMEMYAVHLKKELDISDIEAAVKFYASASAQNAAFLVSFGIIHGQFGVHYQNFSLAGELADFDSTIFVNNLGLVPHDIFAESNYVQNFPNKISELDKMMGTNMMHHIKENRNYVKDNSGDAKASQKAIAGRLLREIYDLYNQGLRAVDLYARSQMNDDINSPGTVLKKQIIHEFKMEFIRHFFTNLKTEKCFTWSYNNGKDRLFDRYLDKIGNHTIYGWYQEGIPNFHFTAICDRSRQEFIVAEAKELFSSLNFEIK